jgi:2-hydroxy-3-keto-5-methylthiopentenyl-1-phosphate phosphatase
MAMESAAPAIVLDFDGTVTEADMLDRVCREFGDPAVYDQVEAAFERGDIRLVDDIEHKLASVRAPLNDVVTWLRAESRLRPGFRDLLGLTGARGWRAVIVTSSFHELVEPVLGDLAEHVELVANRLDARPEGWRAHFVFGDACAVCGEPCKRDLVAQLGANEVVYVGDGYSDRCAAQTAGRVFATGGLARYLDGAGVTYERFEDFHDVIRALDDERAAA